MPPLLPSAYPEPGTTLQGTQEGNQEGVQHRGEQPLEDLQVDFTEVKPSRGYKYLLVMVCAFPGWVEAFPTKTEKIPEVTRALLREIIPRYGLPRPLGAIMGRPSFPVLHKKWPGC